MATNSRFECDRHSFRRLTFWTSVWCGLLLVVSFIPSPGALSASSPQSSQGATGAASAPTKLARAKVRSLEIVLLSTMLTDRAGIGEWGFSALVEADGRRLLFDTGARPETVLRNSRELKIDLSGVTEVILSHHHGDHT